MISVVVPTVTGREDHLARCVEAYETRGTQPVEIIVVKDRPTCGLAWIDGAATATGDYVHFTADDLEPHDFWDAEATLLVDADVVPSPRILGPTGLTEFCGYHHDVELPTGLEVSMRSPVPFLSRAMLAECLPLLPAHYYTDDWVDYRLRRAGHRVVVCRSFGFTHHWAMPGRNAGLGMVERDAVDHAIYRAAVEADA